uniref:Uncharacterized protein n=1 Tax=Oryza meridionalis TaxID=40149 RepID=A0A0E0DJZ2_9ORYZ
MVVVPLGPATRTHSASGKRKPIAATPAADPHLDHISKSRSQPMPLHDQIMFMFGKARKGTPGGRGNGRCPEHRSDPQFVIVPLRGDAMLLAHCILSCQAQKLSSTIPSRIKDAYMHARP